MSKKYNENILAIPRSTFDANGIFQGFLSLEGRSDVGDYLGTGANGETPSAIFIDRNVADGNGKDSFGDPSFKQIIPYCVILCGPNVFTYTRSRSSAEDRLHDKLSIGIGGHVNDKDDVEPFWSYLKGVIRELKEEIGLEVNHDAAQKTLHGLINNDEDEVGRLHLGLVHIINVTEQGAAMILKNCEKTEIDSPRFVSINELGKNAGLYTQLERWSQFVAEKLVSDLGSPGQWTNQGMRERIGLVAIAAGNLGARAAALLMQEEPQGFDLSRGDLERALGELATLQNGLIAAGDVSMEAIIKHGTEFRMNLPNLTRYQTFTQADPAEG